MIVCGSDGGADVHAKIAVCEMSARPQTTDYADIDRLNLTHQRRTGSQILLDRPRNAVANRSTFAPATLKTAVLAFNHRASLELRDLSPRYCVLAAPYSRGPANPVSSTDFAAENASKDAGGYRA